MPIAITCTVCETVFKVKPSRVARCEVQFCSMACKGIASRTRLSLQCKRCGNEFWTTPGVFTKPDRTGEYCSRTCSTAFVNEQRKAEADARLAEQEAAGKTCTRCKQIKPLEAFGLLKGGPRRHPSCKRCLADAQAKRLAENAHVLMAQRARTAEWRATHSEHLADYRKRIYLADPEKARARSLERWSKMDPAEKKERQAAAYYKNIERAREYYQEHKDRFREREKRYSKMYPERVAEKDARRRARKLGATRERVSRAAIIARDASTCYLCGEVLAPQFITLDHVIPLARGGSHTADNLKVACRSCNSKKHKRLLEEIDPSIFAKH